MSFKKIEFTLHSCWNSPSVFIVVLKMFRMIQIVSSSLLWSQKELQYI